MKPTDSTNRTPIVRNTGDRLPAPSRVIAIQQADGSIHVTWSRVPAATSYAIVRSVPPDPAHAITPNVTDTVFVDTRVMAGRTYYYVVSGLNDKATGLRAGAPPVTATRAGSRPSEPVPPTNVVARYDSAKNEVTVTWSPPGTVKATFLVERHYGMTATKWEPLGRVDTPYMTVAARGLPDGTRVQFRVFTLNDALARSLPALSNEVVIGTPRDPKGGPKGGTVTARTGSPLSVRVGATKSAAPVNVGTSGRWISLDEGIATVDASGTVTGHSAGHAQILAVDRGAGGSVRVTLIDVSVVR